MNIILASRKKTRDIEGTIIFLAAIVLIVWLVLWLSAPSYDLTIASTAGGSVITPGEAGPYTYRERTVVNLVAEAEDGYCFVRWTGEVRTITDVTSTATTIVMYKDHSITANFAVPTLVWDWYDLNAIRDDLDGIYILMNDLDSTTAGYDELASPTANGGKGWQPIGNSDNRFTGTFDGQGHEIRDVYISRLDEGGLGLFGHVDEGGTTKNVGVVNANVTGSDCVGGLVGWNRGTISNSYYIGSVTGNYKVGGLVGYHSWDALHDCYSIASVNGEGYVGGLVGRNEATTVSLRRDTFCEGTISDSYSTGSVTGDTWVGGLVGYADHHTMVEDSYSGDSVTGSNNVGGLLAFDEFSTVTNSFWDTETSGQSTSDGGTGKTTAEMQDIAIFSGATWDIVAVANPSIRNPSYIWNIVDDETYPFLSWQPV